MIGDKAAEVDIRIDFAFTDLDQTWTIWVRRGVLNARTAHPRTPNSPSPAPRPPWSASCSTPRPPANSPQAGKIELDGDLSVLTTFAGVLDQFDPNFDIVTP